MFPPSVCGKSLMFRLAVRLTAVLAIVAIGWIAIAKARSGGDAPAETAQASTSAPAKTAETGQATPSSRRAAAAVKDESNPSADGGNSDPFFSAPSAAFSERYDSAANAQAPTDQQQDWPPAQADDGATAADQTSDSPAVDPFSASAADESAADESVTDAGGFSAPSYRNLPASAATSQTDDAGPTAGGIASQGGAGATGASGKEPSGRLRDPFAADAPADEVAAVGAAATSDGGPKEPAKGATDEVTDIGPPTVPAARGRIAERYGTSGSSNAAFRNSQPLGSGDDPFAADPRDSNVPPAAAAADDLAPAPGDTVPPAAAIGGDATTVPRRLAPLDEDDAEPLSTAGSAARDDSVGGATDVSSSREIDPQHGTASNESYVPEHLTSPGNSSRQEGFPPEDLREAVLADEGPGVPGDKRLEGAQLPALSIVKLAPEEIQVGKPAGFEIEVQNTGRVAAHGVIVRDQVPRGTSFRGAEPQAAVSPAGELEWSLETLQPGDKRLIKIELMPLREGVVGSVATVHLAAQAAVRTLCTKPELRIDVLSPPSEVLIGNELTLSIRISNPGSGPATGILLTEHMPPGLTHADVQGNELEYEVGDLKPKESRDIKLRLKAAQAGPQENLLTAVGDGSLRAEARTPVTVVAPALAVAIDGPRHRYLERPAVYAITLKNEGTASAQEVQLAAYIPKGFKFVSANNLGSFDSGSRIVAWELAELPPNLPAVVEVKLVPIEPGDQTLEVTSKGRRELFAQAEHAVKVEGVAALQFHVADTADPIEIGGETTYEVSVANQGSKSATDVTLTAILPPELEGVDASGPSESQVRGNRVEFAPLRTLAPRAEVTFKIRAKAAGPGNPQLRVELTSADSTDPVIKQESTRVYADR